MKILNNKFIKDNRLLLSILFAVVFLMSFYLFIFSNVDIVCAKYSEISKVRGSKMIIYKFRINNKLHEGNFDITTLSNVSNDEIEKLKKSNCIKIEVSNYWSFFNKVVEK